MRINYNFAVCTTQRSIILCSRVKASIDQQLNSRRVLHTPSAVCFGGNGCHLFFCQQYCLLMKCCAAGTLWYKDKARREGCASVPTAIINKMCVFYCPTALTRTGSSIICALLIIHSTQTHEYLPCRKVILRNTGQCAWWELNPRPIFCYYNTLCCVLRGTLTTRCRA